MYGTEAAVVCPPSSVRPPTCQELRLKWSNLPMSLSVYCLGLYLRHVDRAVHCDVGMLSPFHACSRPPSQSRIERSVLLAEQTAGTNTMALGFMALACKSGKSQSSAARESRTRFPICCIHTHAQKRTPRDTLLREQLTPIFTCMFCMQAHAALCREAFLMKLPYTFQFLPSQLL